MDYTNTMTTMYLDFSIACQNMRGNVLGQQRQNPDRLQDAVMDNLEKLGAASKWPEFQKRVRKDSRSPGWDDLGTLVMNILDQKTQLLRY